MSSLTTIFARFPLTQKLSTRGCPHTSFCGGTVYVHFTLKALLYWAGFDPVSFCTKSALTSGSTPTFFCFLSYFLSLWRSHIFITSGLSDSQYSLRTWLLRLSVMPITLRIDYHSLRARRDWKDLDSMGLVLACC